MFASNESGRAQHNPMITREQAIEDAANYEMDAFVWKKRYEILRKQAQVVCDVRNCGLLLLDAAIRHLNNEINHGISSRFPRKKERRYVNFRLTKIKEKSNAAKKTRGERRRVARLSKSRA